MIAIYQTFETHDNVVGMMKLKILLHYGNYRFSSLSWWGVEYNQKKIVYFRADKIDED